MVVQSIGYNHMIPMTVGEYKSRATSYVHWSCDDRHRALKHLVLDSLAYIWNGLASAGRIAFSASRIRHFRLPFHSSFSHQC